MLQQRITQSFLLGNYPFLCCFTLFSPSKQCGHNHKALIHISLLSLYNEQLPWSDHTNVFYALENKKKYRTKTNFKNKKQYRTKDTA